MKKNILIPTDFSKNSWNALNYALSLFKDEKCTFYLVNAFQLYYFTTDSLIVPEPGEPNYEKAKETSEIGLEGIIDGITSRGGNEEHSFETISTYNTVLEAVKAVIEKNDIELVIMGTKGENDPTSKLYGSNAVDVMEKIINCPVIVIPENSVYAEEKRKEVVFATNFKTAYRRRDMENLVDIAKKMKAAIRVLHIQEADKLSGEQEKNKEDLQEYLGDVVFTFHTLTDIKVAPGIHSFIESRDSDLLALINKKHSFLNSIFTKSLVKEIGYKPQVPVLVMHHGKE